MRAFVIGTGRCGTSTVAAACQHMTNYTCTHERYRGRFPKLAYPDNHIEVDAYLQLHLGALLDLYPDAVYVHLARNAEDCIASIAEREETMAAYCRLLAIPVDCRVAAELFYDRQNRLIDKMLPDGHLKMSLEDIGADFTHFWNVIGAEGDLDAAKRELSVKHNARVAV